MTYSEKLKDPRWQRKRLDILKRDDFTCRDCGAINKTLHVHHCHYDGGDPWKANDDVLLTLCEDCHIRRGKVEADAKLMFAQIMAALPHDPGLQEDLLGLVDSMARLIEKYRNNPYGFQDGTWCPVEVIDGMEREYREDMRWFQYACGHPEARKCYTDVTGNTFPWSKYDERQNSSCVSGQ
jgi:hypothetical protein